MSVNYELIGKRIQEIRKGKRVSQEKLAEMVDLSTQYMSQIENAKRKASLNTIVYVTALCGYALDGKALLLFVGYHGIAQSEAVTISEEILCKIKRSCAI